MGLISASLRLAKNPRSTTPQCGQLEQVIWHWNKWKVLQRLLVWHQHLTVSANAKLRFFYNTARRWSSFSSEAVSFARFQKNTFNEAVWLSYTQYVVCLCVWRRDVQFLIAFLASQVTFFPFLPLLPPSYTIYVACVLSESQFRLAFPPYE